MNLLLFLLLASVPHASPLWAATDWELCMDQVKFNLDTGMFSPNAGKMAKEDCKINVATFGNKGEKFEINLCDSKIHIDYYPAIDASTPSLLYAGSAVCPSPVFGADDLVTDGGASKFEAARKKIYSLLHALMKIYAQTDNTDLSKVKDFTQESNYARLACTEKLLDSYLNQCVSFTELKKKTLPIVTNSSDLPPGVHPETIIRKREKAPH